MNLHDDPDVFSELVAATATHIGLPEVYVEKDYWVTRALKHLSESAHSKVVVFKGGTSLSKAYRLIDRFSEDIDLAVFAPDRSGNARSKLLKKIERAATQGLELVSGDERKSKNSSFRKTVYQYPRRIEGGNFGQASPELMIEVNSFTTPEPFEERELQSLVAEMLISVGKQDLIEVYGLQCFSLQILSVRRTLVEKILGAIKDSHKEDAEAELSKRIRHLYDICLILKHDEHRSFVSGDDFSALCDRCVEDERNLPNGPAKFLEIPLAEAPLFFRFAEWRSSLSATYLGVFQDLVYGDLPTMQEIEETLSFIKEHL